MKEAAIYLAGAIRDGIDYDIDWREQAINELSWARGVTVLSPLAGKSYGHSFVASPTKRWYCCGIEPGPTMIVKQDFAMIERADVVLFNFLPLLDGYRMIGTCVELGYAAAKGKLCFAVWPEGLQASNAIYNIHPFVEQNCAVVFKTLEDAIHYLVNYFDVMTGLDPHFKETL